MEAYIYKVPQEELEFQDIVMEKLNSIGIHIQIYSSKRYQWTKGETIQGVEIKHDKQLKKYGNIYIEYAETNRKGEWVDSGILKEDNAWLYVIGDSNKLYIFEKRTLAYMYYEGKDLAHKELIHKNIGTSKGFLLKAVEAEKWAKVL